MYRPNLNRSFQPSAGFTLDLRQAPRNSKVWPSRPKQRRPSGHCLSARSPFTPERWGRAEEARDTADEAVRRELVEVHSFRHHLAVAIPQQPAHAHGIVMNLRRAAAEPGAWILPLKAGDLLAQRGAARDVGRGRVAINT